MAKLKKEDAVNIIKSRDLVSSDVNGSYVTAKVNSVSPHSREDGTQVMIVNLALMNNYHLAQAKELLAAGDTDGAVNKHYSHSLRANASFIPTKGDKVKVLIEELTTKNDVTGQFITAMSPLAIASTSKVSFDIEVEEAVEETIEEVLGKK